MNNDIKVRIKLANLTQWEVAAEIGITPSTFCVWLRGELSAERRQRIDDAIKKLSRRGAVWRNARDEIPEDQAEVLVCTRSKNGVRNIDKGYWSIDRWIHRGCAEVTHWMPLPPFPEDQ